MIYFDISHQSFGSLRFNILSTHFQALSSLLLWYLGDNIKLNGTICDNYFKSWFRRKVNNVMLKSNNILHNNRTQKRSSKSQLSAANRNLHLSNAASNNINPALLRPLPGARPSPGNPATSSLEDKPPMPHLLRTTHGPTIRLGAVSSRLLFPLFARLESRERTIDEDRPRVPPDAGLLVPALSTRNP